MRIEKIILKNYRQFRQAKISFLRRNDSDLHYVIGTNGTGKTNILNAINWCLYNDEPHLSKDSQRLPVVNLQTIDKIGIGKDIEVAVEVWAETDDDAKVTFKRQAKFIKSDDGQIIHQGTKFELMTDDERGNTKIITGEEADGWVERFVPKSIREFFFFDGEQLDNYFKEATGQNIQHAVFQVSQIDLLENRVERKLQEILDDYTKDAGKMNPKIEIARAKLEQAQSQLNEVQKRIEECKKQIEISRIKIVEFADKLKGVPDIEALDQEKQLLLENFKNTKDLLKAKKIEKEGLLIECGSILMLWPAIEMATKVIEEKKTKRELPPPVDKGFLEDILRNESCSVCGRSLDERSNKRVHELLGEVEFSSETSQRLVQMENPLWQFKEKAESFDKQRKSTEGEITSLDKVLNGITQKISQIDSQMAGYKDEQIRDWYRERKKFEDIRDNNQLLLGGLLENRKVAESTVEEAKSELDNELKKEKKAKGLAKKVAFCTRALEIVRSTREAMMAEARERIEIETRKCFFGLVWKTATFKDIKILPDYSISLIHKMGYECMGSLSAGERELLALSFTLALHQASGFDSPILIDTPVARISGLNRENVAKVLCEVSTYKQIVLLLTPDEHSKDVSKIIDGRACGRYLLTLSSDENQAILEVL